MTLPPELSDEWDDYINVARAILVGPTYLNPKPVPSTGPADLDVTWEIARTLARLTVLAEYEVERVKMMELAGHQTMIAKWVKTLESEAVSLGFTAITMQRTLKKHGY